MASELTAGRIGAGTLRSGISDGPRGANDLSARDKSPNQESALAVLTGRIISLRGRAESVSRQAEKIADDTFGPLPEADARGKLSPAPCGRVDLAHQCVDELEFWLLELEAQIGRLGSI